MNALLEKPLYARVGCKTICVSDLIGASLEPAAPRTVDLALQHTSGREDVVIKDMLSQFSRTALDAVSEFLNKKMPLEAFVKKIDELTLQTVLRTADDESVSDEDIFSTQISCTKRSHTIVHATPSE